MLSQTLTKCKLEAASGSSQVFWLTRSIVVYDLSIRIKLFGHLFLFGFEIICRVFWLIMISVLVLLTNLSQLSPFIIQEVVTCSNFVKFVPDFGRCHFVMNHFLRDQLNRLQNFLCLVVPERRSNFPPSSYWIFFTPGAPSLSSYIAKSVGLFYFRAFLLCAHALARNLLRHCVCFASVDSVSSD